MAERTDLPTRQPTPARPNRILSEPATPAACAGDYRPRSERRTPEGAARDQSAFARMRPLG